MQNGIAFGDSFGWASLPMIWVCWVINKWEYIYKSPFDNPH